MISSLSSIKKDVITMLKASPLFYEVSVTSEFSGSRSGAKSYPVVVVGIDSVELAPGGFGGFLGSGEGYNISGNFANVTLRFNINVGDNDTKNSCHSIFENLCTCLISSDLSVSKVDAGGISSRKGAFENSLVAKATLVAALTQRESKQTINDFVLKRGEGD